ncbi:hypothetical protein HDV00_009119 [Rhizophlyctis rosea]|nr:hypothetical protein HDV00_009119 [Rhizophlyctis rosea]
MAPVPDTTRQPRPGEIPGQSYHYITQDEFLSLIDKNAFVEHAEFSGNRYGTSIEAIHAVQEKDKICVLDLEIKGVRSIKASDMGAVYCFIQPPSVEALEARLRGRGTESEESLKKRLDTAKEAMDFAAQDGNYDIVIINDKAEEAYQQLEKWILETWEITEEPAIWAEPTSPSEKGAKTTGAATDTTVPPGPQAPSTEGPTQTVKQDILPTQVHPDGPPGGVEKRGEENSDRAAAGEGEKKGEVEEATKQQEEAKVAGDVEGAETTVKVEGGGEGGVAAASTENAVQPEGAQGGEDGKKKKKKEKGDKKSAVCVLL